MTPIPLNASIVVLAESHNPSILHPSFLSSQSIVPASWSVTEHPICTPAFAAVKYTSGVHFLVETSKLQVIDTSPPEDLATSEVASIACKYLGALPHVPFKAVGINFLTLVEIEDPEQHLASRFLREGAWTTQKELKAFSARFVYDAEPGRLRISCDPGEVEVGGSGMRSGILVSLNFHMDNTKSIGAATQAITLFSTRCEQLGNFVQLLLG